MLKYIYKTIYTKIAEMEALLRVSCLYVIYCLQSWVTHPFIYPCVIINL